MLANSMRGVASVVGALMLAFVGVVGVEVISSILHPFPPGVDPTNFKACKEHVARYPKAVLLLIRRMPPLIVMAPVKALAPFERTRIPASFFWNPFVVVMAFVLTKRPALSREPFVVERGSSAAAP